MWLGYKHEMAISHHTISSMILWILSCLAVYKICLINFILSMTLESHLLYFQFIFLKVVIILPPFSCGSIHTAGKAEIVHSHIGLTLSYFSILDPLTLSGWGKEIGNRKFPHLITYVMNNRLSGDKIFFLILENKTLYLYRTNIQTNI